MTDNNTVPDVVQPKEKFNFWRFIRLCSLRDFNKFKDEQCQTLTDLKNRLAELEEKLNNKTVDVQKTVDGIQNSIENIQKSIDCAQESVNNVQKSIADFHQDFSDKQSESLQNIDAQINELKSEFKKNASQLQVNISNITEAIGTDLTSSIDKIVSRLTTELNQQITSSQEALSSSLEIVMAAQDSIVNQVKEIDNTNKSAQYQIISACESVENCHEQLKQQTEIHFETQKLCADLMESVHTLVLTTLSEEIELLLPPDSSKNNKSEKSSKENNQDKSWIKSAAKFHP